MPKTKRTLLLTFLIIITIFGTSPISSVRGQTPEPPNDNRGIDMMLVIDNSCSMFSDEVAQQNGECAEGGGNDTDLLRIIGAEIFFDSLGLGNLLLEDRHQIGVISFSGESQLIHNLAPIRDLRNVLTSKVQNPTPQPWTDIEQALRDAYDELERAGLPNNTPAIVLITDGKPETSFGQPYNLENIETLLQQHPDVPVFIMLVQNNENLSDEYADYISFWQQTDVQNSHIFHYVIEEQQQIDDTYQDVLTQITGESTGSTTILQPNEPQRFFVNEFIQALRITVIHNDLTNKGNITITDPNGNTVQPEPGNDVRFSSGDDVGRVDVIYIGEGYLTPERKNAYWTIESDALVEIIRIPTGAYRINFTQPDISFTQIRNVYDTISPHPISQPLVIRFNLLRKDDNSTVYSSQSIDGFIINPDGSESDFPIPTDLQPDENGYYELPPYQFPITSDDEFTSYQIILHAGVADPQAAHRIPIAKAVLFIRVGRFPSIGTISPTDLVCTAQAINLSITINDYEYAIPSSVQVRVFAMGKDVFLEPTSSDLAIYRGDMSPLCTSLLANLECSTSDSVVMTARLNAQMQNGAPAPPSQKDIQVQLIAPTCPTPPAPTPTFTPTPTPTPTPSPPPPPPPDRDRDGGPDSVDWCATLPGESSLRYCPSWILIPIALLVIGIGIGLWKFVGPWLWVRTPWGKPPIAYIRICNKNGKGNRSRDVGIYSKGIQHRSSNVTIGGGRKKSHILVKELESPIEFVVKKEGTDVVILNVKKNTKKTFNKRTGDQVTTSNKDIMIYIALDPNKLKKC